MVSDTRPPAPGKALRAAALSVALSAGLAVACWPAAARDYFVAAEGAAGGADGSAGNPWPSIQAALDSGALAGGDRLLLAPGSHGALQIKQARFEPPLTITSAPDGRAHLDKVDIRQSSGLVLTGLDVWPRPEPGKREPGPVVAADRESSAITFDQLDIRSVPDAPSYRDWDTQTWLANRRLGVRLESADSTLSASTVTGVSGGVNVVGARAQVIGNEIRGFSKDGMRIFGKNSHFQGNTIRDCVKIDSNHDDGVQSWVGKQNADKAVIGIVFEGNRILEWTGPPDHPLRCSLQGIGLFNGPYRDWVIQNNLIVVRAFHGIALYNMHGARVVNNTVVHPSGKAGKNPWIRLDKQSQNGSNLVANNVAMSIQMGKGVPLGRNIKVTSPERLFEDLGGFDYRPKAGGALVDAADPAFAPRRDIDDIPRPLGRGPDMGAYERR